MTPQVIQFHCPRCNAPLTVPIHLAGITGPCPKCGSSITSPAAPGPSPAPVPTPAPAPVSTPLPILPNTQDIQVPQMAPAAPALPTFPPAPSWTQSPAAPPPAPAEAAPSPLPPPRPTPAEPTHHSLLAGFHPGPSIPPPALEHLPTSPARSPEPVHSGLIPGAPLLPTLGSEPSPAASNAGSLPCSFLNPQETPSAIPQQTSLPVAPTSTTLPESPLRPRLSVIQEIDPSVQLSKRSRKPLPPIPGRPSKGSNFLRLSIAALFIFGAIGALLFAFKDPLTDLYYQHIAPLFVLAEESEPVEPSPAPTLTDTDPVETIKPAVAETAPKAKPPPAKPAASNPMPPATSLDTDTDVVKPKPPIDSQIPPTPDGNSVPEIVKPAMPALPGDLPAPPTPKTSLM